jgi:hypothetical protein
MKPRLLLLTDISSLETGVREPDDAQSLIRLLLYSNEIDIVGLYATSNMRHGHVCRPELIRQVIAAYGEVQPNLLLHHPDYPPARELLACVGAGNPVAGPDIAPEACVGEGFDTEASEAIIRAADTTDTRPLWIAVWGGTADLAQALWKVRATRSPEDCAAFVTKLRIHAVYDQDSTGAWIKREFPELYYITRHHGIRGMYRGGDTSPVSSDWVEENIQQGHGPLGALYPNYNGGDIWGSRYGRVQGIKEGDTPSFLPLIANGLGNNRGDFDQTLGTWGGRFQQGGTAYRFTDAEDTDSIAPEDADPRMGAVYRWRAAYQNDFAARLDWCVKPYAEANHPPQVHIEGAHQRTVRSGEEVVLDACASQDCDGHALTFQWSVYPSVAEYNDASLLQNPNSPLSTFIAPTVDTLTRFPLLLTVTNDGNPPLTRYGRVRVTVET